MDQKSVKIIGIFLALIMVMSILPFFFSGNGNNSKGDEEITDLENAPGFEIIKGTHFNAQVNSISGGLAISPEGVSNAVYVDYSRTYGTPLQDYNISDLYAYYNTLMIQRFAAYNASAGFGFEAHVLNPEVINFEYAVTDTYNGYSFLMRSSNLYNIIGTPTLLGDKDTLVKVVDVASGNTQGTTDFSELLSYVDSGAEYQMVSSTDSLAEQHYMEFRNMGDGNYSKTEIFLNPLDSTLATISALEGNSTERDLFYNTTIVDDGRIAKVVVTTNASNFFNLAMEQYW